jgi:hypothetical protein
MSARLSLLALCLTSFATTACSGGGLSPSSDGGHDAATFDAGKSDGAIQPRVPTNHRPNDAQCATTPGPGSCNAASGAPGNCGSDSTCTAGTNGRCDFSGGGVLSCQCSYDGCQHDTDCPTNQLCACHGSPLLTGGNTCEPGNCRVDSDCGANGYCSPSAGTGNCGGLAGYYCHTAQDTCVNDTDCNSNTTGDSICEYAGDHWSCQQELLCG